MIEGIMEVGSLISFPALVVPQLGSLTGVQHPPLAPQGAINVMSLSSGFSGGGTQCLATNRRSAV